MMLVEVSMSLFDSEISVSSSSMCRWQTTHRLVSSMLTTTLLLLIEVSLLRLTMTMMTDLEISTS